MKMEFSDNVGDDLMVITHGDKRLEFDVSTYKRAMMSGNNGVIAYINQYWAQLPAFHQEKIFGIYGKILSVFSQYLPTAGMRQELMPLVRELYAEHDLEDLEYWIFMRTDIRVPAKFEELYVHSDEVPFSRDKTYTKPDYAKLVTLALSLRIMLPVWGEFICRTESDTGSKFKEFNAFTLLALSKVNESPAMEKLRIYIKSNIQMTDASVATAVVKGVGLEDYPTWVLSSLLVKRLAVGDIRGAEPNTNLVITIHNDISAKNNGNNGGNFGELLQKKTFDADSNDDNGVSRQENFKIKEERSTGIIEAIETYVDVYLANIAERLMPGVNISELDDYVAQAQEMGKYEIKKGQIQLAQLVTGHIVEPEGVYNLSKAATIKLLAVSQMYLWKSGHQKLSVLTTAVPGESLSHGGIGSTARISRGQMDLLEKYYPFNRVSAKRKNTIPKNAAVEAIDAITAELSAGDWLLTCTDAQATEVIGTSNTRRYGCPHDIKILLAKLAIEMVERERDAYRSKLAIRNLNLTTPRI